MSRSSRILKTDDRRHVLSPSILLSYTSVITLLYIFIYIYMLNELLYFDSEIREVMLAREGA